MEILDFLRFPIGICMGRFSGTAVVYKIAMLKGRGAVLAPGTFLRDGGRLMRSLRAGGVYNIFGTRRVDGVGAKNNSWFWVEISGVPMGSKIGRWGLRAALIIGSRL